MGEKRDVFCPECEEPVQAQPPRIWACGTDRPAYSHLDGEPLCPVMTGAGYLPAEPVTQVPAE
ncbi:hypothetical protein [Streptomonospora salina]|uniref:Uncharacterized protein n=1 Tax=Streptomonospora salina TaxID=104205 RepID=A0A841EGN1_9ACTN|nr:hypothetical protein [Streptomonospora salina]MBB6000183.1 hypothetical protein [Streptomonospora salina]